MNRRSVLLATALMLGISLLGGISLAQAQQANEAAVKSAIDAYHSALGSLDAKKMAGLWAHLPYAVLINPSDKAISVGWADVNKNWEDTFNTYSELKVTQSDGPYIHIKGNTAWASGIASATGSLKSGVSFNNSLTYELDVFEKFGRQWFLVSHSAVRVPK